MNIQNEKDAFGLCKSNNSMGVKPHKTKKIHPEGWIFIMRENYLYSSTNLVSLSYLALALWSAWANSSSALSGKDCIRRL